MRWLIVLLAATITVATSFGQDFDPKKLWEPPNLWEPSDPFAPVKPKSDPEKTDKDKPPTLPPIPKSQGKNPLATWRAPKELSVEGAKYFDAAEIRTKLLSNLEVLDARHPLAPRQAYVVTLEDRCRAGYLHEGFCDVRVRGQLDEENSRATLSIDEGHQWRCGNVKVTNAAHFHPVELATWLTTKQPPNEACLAGFTTTETGDIPNWIKRDGSAVDPEDAAWEVAGPFRSDETDQQALRQKISRGLAELGLPWAQFAFRYQLDEDSHQADLHIEILDEGPRAIVKEIEVVGNRRDSAEDIIQYLKIAPNTLLRETDRNQLWFKLWSSGRYRFQSVDLIRPIASSEPVKLRIEVWEYAPVTPLRERLTDAEQTLLRCREWLLDTYHHGDDFVATVGDDSRMEVVTSPKNGVLLAADFDRLFSDNTAGKRDDRQPRLLTLTLRPDAMQLALAGVEKCLRSPVGKGRVFVDWRFVPLFNAESPDDDEFNLQYGCGYSSSKSDQESNIGWRLRIAPAAMLALLYKYEPQVQIEKGKLSIKSKMDSLVIDKESGALLEFRSSPTSLYGQRLIASFKPNAYLPKLEEIDQRCEGHLSSAVNAIDLDRPFSSVALYLLDDARDYLTLPWGSDSPQVRRPVAALQKLVAGGLLRPLDEWASAQIERTDTETTREFRIPVKIGRYQQSGGVLTMCIGNVAEQVSKLNLPDESWPAVLLRLSIGIAMNRNRYVESDMQLLLTRENYGPIAHLATAELLAWLNPTASVSFAKAGINALSVERFCKDCEPLLDRSNRIGEFVCHVCESLNELSSEEAQGLGRAFLGNGVGDKLSSIAEALRESSGQQPVEEVLKTLLAAQWNTEIRPVIESRLRTLAGEQGEENVAAIPAKSGDTKKE